MLLCAVAPWTPDISWPFFMSVYTIFDTENDSSNMFQYEAYV
jgi:hypothetical protein